MTTPRKSNPAYLVLVAVALAIVALARPQWGVQATQSFSQSVEVVIALDLSRSMATDDLPNRTARLPAAKATLERILDGLKGENVGLVLFAGTAFVQVPMSPDYQILRKFLPSLTPDYMPVGGTDYDRMLAAALEGFSPAGDRERYLIVLSDGEDTRPVVEQSMRELIRRNVHVIGIGFGPERGALLSLATRTEGQYVPASALPNAAAVFGNVTVGIDRFQWFLVPAVLVGLLSLVVEFRRHPRTRTLRRPATAGAALMVLICMTLIGVFVPQRVQAHFDSEAGFEVQENFTGDPAQRVRAIVTHMGKFGYDPFDLKLQVQAAMQFAIEERAHGRLPLLGVMRDAVEAARMGKKLDPSRAQWDRYESRIRELLAPLPVEAQARDAEHPVEAEDFEDEQHYKPAPLRKAKEKEGRDLFGKNIRSRSEFALGDLSGEETFAPQEAHGGRRTPPKPLPTAAQTAEALPANDPTVVEARKNFEIIVKADSPARVHQLLNGEGKRVVEQDR